MKRTLLFVLLFCMVGFSMTRVINFTTVGDDFEQAKTSFTSGETIWLKVVIINDENVSYPSVTMSYFYLQNVNYSSYYYTQGFACDAIYMNEGINPGETKTAYTNCTMRNDTAKSQYRLGAYLIVGGSWQWYDTYFDLNPEQPWVGAVITKITFNETNDQNHKFPIGHKFKANTTVYNFNPAQSLTANLSTYSYPGGPYVTCDPIGEVTIPPNSNGSFVTECTTGPYFYNYFYSVLHLGSNMWSNTISYLYNYAYVDVGTCGNGIIEPPNYESCDLTNMTYTLCADYNPGWYESGSLTCTSWCYYNAANCVEKPRYYVSTNYVLTSKTLYWPGENVSISARITNYGNRNLIAGSYLTVKFEDITSWPYKVLLEQNASVGGLPVYSSIEKQFSFITASALLYFRVSAYTYFENGTLINTPGSINYISPEPVMLNCTNATEGGIVSLNCTGTGTVRKMLKMPKSNGTLVTFKTSPRKGLYFWEIGDNIYIMDNPSNTVYFVNLWFAAKAAPSLDVTLALILMFFLSFFVWERYVE